MHIILFILLIIGFIIIFGLSVIGAILRSLFGIGRRPHASTYNGEERSSSNRSSNNFGNNTEEVSPNSKVYKHKKIFSKDEGEYVDFEEIKE